MPAHHTSDTVPSSSSSSKPLSRHCPDVISVFEGLEERLSEGKPSKHSLPSAPLGEASLGNNQSGDESWDQDHGEGDDEEYDEGYEDEKSEQEKEAEEGEIYQYPSSEEGDEDDVFWMANGGSFDDPNPAPDDFLQLAEEYFYAEHKGRPDEAADDKAGKRFLP